MINISAARYKKIQAVFICVLFIFPALSSADYFDNKYIFGISFIKQFANIRTATNTQAYDTGSGLGFYFDRYYQQKYRFNGTFNYVGFSKYDVASVITSADYLYPVKTNISLFAGAAFGASMQKYNDDGFGAAAASLVYGLQFGAITYLSESHLIEMGVRIRKTNLDTASDPNSTATTTIRYLNELYFSTLFMF